MKKNIVIFSSTNFTKNYSTVQYLADALIDLGCKVNVFAEIPKSDQKILKGNKFLTRSMYSGVAGYLPRIRKLLFKQKIYKACISKKCDAIICSELGYYDTALKIKKKRPDLPFILLAQELLTPEVNPTFDNIKMYADNANVPDLTIDVDPYRAKHRKEKFGIRKEIVICPNTLPSYKQQNIDNCNQKTFKQISGKDIGTRPLIIYAGGLHKAVCFDRIIEAFEGLDIPHFFAAFCHGSKEQIELYKDLFNNKIHPDNGAFFNAVPRSVLLSILQETVAGIVYYPETAENSLNQKYASPTKLAEYISMGAAVICSANVSLKKLVEENLIGVCAKDDSVQELRNAIRSLLADGEKLQTMRENAKIFFSQEFCFQICSKDTISAILELLKD